MILLNSASKIQIVTGSAAQIEVHASATDRVTATGAVTPFPINVPIITTAATTDLAATTATPAVAASPAAGSVRNIKHLNITNDHATASCVVTVDHTDGTTPIELISVTLLPAENLVLGEDGRWVHHDANGAEYPPAGKGAYNGFSVGFMKTSTPADAAGYFYSTHKDSGFPGAWVPGTPGVNGRNPDGTNSADFGCFPIKNPATGANYLTELQVQASLQHTNIFFDVLWVNSGLVVTTTTAQTLTQAALPARDINGSTNGEGCNIAMLFVTAASSAAVISNSTVSYTNSDGTAGRTATLQAQAGAQIPATPVVGTVVWFSLQAGDKGVRSIQSVTLGTSLATGSISMMVTRTIATLGNPIVNVAASKAISEPGIRLYNGTCLLHAILASATTATFFSGELVIQEK
jgi:hypothetical protein